MGIGPWLLLLRLVEECAVKRQELWPKTATRGETCDADEWRVHFHIPLHSEPEAMFATTADHLTGTLDVLAADRSLCKHLEMETYTWEVMPAAMHSDDVVDQLEKEYGWTLEEMSARGLA